MPSNIDTCVDCPFLEYDPYYDISVDSGYDCKLLGIRIASNSECRAYKEFCKEKESRPLFKSSEDIKNPFIIPDACPYKKGIVIALAEDENGNIRSIYVLDNSELADVFSLFKKAKIDNREIAFEVIDDLSKIPESRVRTIKLSI